MREIDTENLQKGEVKHMYDKDEFISEYLQSNEAILLQFGGEKIHESAIFCTNSYEIIEKAKNKIVFVFNLKNIDFTPEICECFNKNILNNYNVYIYNQ